MRPTLRALAPALITGGVTGAYIGSSPFTRRFRADPPEVWGAAAVAAAVGVAGFVRHRDKAGAVGAALGLASPVFANWYLHSYSDFERSDDLDQTETFPAFRLPTSAGGEVSSDDLKGRRTMVMTYRGGWCPFCVTELSELRDNYQAILDRDVDVYAVSVDDPAQSEAMRKRVGLDITFLSDNKGTLLADLGINDDAGLPPGLSAAGYGGQDLGATVYLPTTFLLDEDNKIRWIHRADNYRVRATPDRVLAAIDSSF